MSERDLWIACIEYIRNGGDQHGFQQFWGKVELLKLYPYLLSWEVYNFLKYGYEGLYICKNCGEQITKLHEKDFCSLKCKGEYKTNEYKADLHLLWNDAKKLCCENKDRRTLKNTNREYNPLSILSKLYDIEPRYIFKYLTTGIDHYDKKPKHKPYEYKSWEDIMGIEKASERKSKMIERQTGKKHSKEWIDNQKAWYRNEDNMNKFKEIIKYTSNSQESHTKQSKRMKKIIQDGYFTPSANGGRRKSRGYYFENLHFRSRFEIIYYAYSKYISSHIIQFENIRIPYFDTKLNKERIYITDFYNKTTNEIIEIKPQSCIIPELKDKLVGVSKYIKSNNIKYKVVTEKTLKSYLKSLMELEFIQSNETFKDIAKVYKRWIEE